MEAKSPARSTATGLFGMDTSLWPAHDRVDSRRGLWISNIGRQTYQKVQDDKRGHYAEKANNPNE